MKKPKPFTAPIFRRHLAQAMFHLDLARRAHVGNPKAGPDATDIGNMMDGRVSIW